MSTSISNSFVKDYQTDLIHAFQRKGSQLRPGVRFRPNVIGETSAFQLIGKGKATTKARHGKITPMNQDHTPAVVTLADFYASDWVDKLDETKITIDEKLAIAEGGSWALGRKVDEQIFEALATTSQDVVTITVTSKAAIEAGLITWVESLNVADVPNDGGRYGAVTPRLWSQMLTIDAFSSADFVGTDKQGLPFVTGGPGFGSFKNWLGINWMQHVDVPGQGTSTADPFIWHKNALGYAAAALAGNISTNDQVSADFWWSGERQAWFITNLMSGGAVAIDDAGIIQALVNDETAVATS